MNATEPKKEGQSLNEAGSMKGEDEIRVLDLYFNYQNWLK